MRPSVESQWDPLGSLPSGLRDLLLTNGEITVYRPGSIIVAADGSLGRMGFLLSGSADICRRGADGREIHVNSLAPGDLFGDAGLLGGDSWPDDVSIVAREECQALLIPTDGLTDRLRAAPDLGVALVKRLAQRIARLDRTVLACRMARLRGQSLIGKRDGLIPDHILADYLSDEQAASLKRLAESAGPILIMGEAGVGKEFAAHSAYLRARSFTDVFLTLNVGRLDLGDLSASANRETAGDSSSVQTLQKELLFGSEDAPGDSEAYVPGYVDLADEGTLLLRDAQELSPEVQSALLERISNAEGEFCSGPRFRLIATTTLRPADVDPKSHPLIHALLDRSLLLSPLRTRKKDIPRLVYGIVERYAAELGRDVPAVPRRTLDTLLSYEWPGNVEELALTLKRAILACEGAVLQPRDIYFDLKAVDERGKFDLLRLGAVKRVLTSPLFPAALQSAVAPFFLILLALLFFGPRDPLQNPGALFAWAIGWPTLIIGAFLFGRLWCSVCPIGTLSASANRMLSLGRPFPAVLRRHSDFLIAGAVLFVIWFETGTEIRQSPLNLGLLLLVMTVSALFVAVVFERRSWCTYLCGLGGMIGVSAKASLIELRADTTVCSTRCSSNDCFAAGSDGGGCPFGQVLPRMDSNRLCNLCGRCVKSCPHDAVRLNLRIPGRELWEMRRANAGIAFLVLGMLGGLLSETATKTPLYAAFAEQVRMTDLATFTIAFVGLIVALNGTHLLAAVISGRVTGTGVRDQYIRYGLALIPLTLTSFMAFHTYYLSNLGGLLVDLLRRDFGFSGLEAGTPAFPETAVHGIQIALVAIGLVWTLLIMRKLATLTTETWDRSVAASAPHLLTATGLAILVATTMGYFFYG